MQKKDPIKNLNTDHKKIPQILPRYLDAVHRMSAFLSFFILYFNFSPTFLCYNIIAKQRHEVPKLVFASVNKKRRSGVPQPSFGNCAGYLGFWGHSARVLLFKEGNCSRVQFFRVKLIFINTGTKIHFIIFTQKTKFSHCYYRTRKGANRYLFLLQKCWRMTQ